MSPGLKMFYVPRLDFAGGLVDRVYVRAESQSDAREKARVLFDLPNHDNIGPAQELSAAYVAAMGITETVR